MMEKEFLDSLARIFERDLGKLEEEIRQYPDESSVWQIKGSIKNSAGNLCLHLCGNLQHYIGKVLGHSNYVRNRDNEFAARNIAKNELLAEIGRTKERVIKTLKTLDTSLLNQPYPEKVFDYPMTTMFFLQHLLGHFNYHLGQINYHRRLIGA